MSDIRHPKPFLLSEVTIRHFRSLENVGPIPIHAGVTVLTGHNDGGKTACFDAIAALLSDYQIDSDDRSTWADDLDEVVIEGTLAPLDGEGDPMRLRVRWSAEHGQTREVLSRVHRGLGVSDPDELKIADLRSRIRKLGIKSPGGTRKQPLVDATRSWLAARPDHEFEQSWQLVTTPTDSYLPTLQRFTAVAAPDPASHVQTVFTREMRRLLQTDKYTRGLTAISERLNTDLEPALKDLRSKIKEYCPDLDDVSVDAEPDFTRPALKVRLRVHKAGSPIDLDKSGEGLRRRMTLAIHEAGLQALEREEPTETAVFLYDEPDTHLDYASQRALYDILERQAALEHVQVLVATHSLNFIDRVDLDSVVHFQLDEEQRTRIEILAAATHEKERQFAASVAAGLGLRNSVLLDERCFLIVEGPTENAAIPGLFRLWKGRSILSSGITLLSTDGSGAVRRLVRVVKDDWNRPIIVLADSDTRDDNWFADLGLTEGADLFFVGDREFEDAFTDETWLRVLSQRFPPADGSEWTLDDVANLRTDDTKFSSALRDLVRRRCRDNRIGKPDLGFALAEVLDESGDLPEPLVECFRAADTLSA